MNSVSDTAPTGSGEDPVDDARVDVLRQSSDKIDQSSQTGTQPAPPVIEETIDLSARLENAQPGPTSFRSEKPGEMLRLLREPRSGQLLVEIAGERYARLSDITDRDTGLLVLQLAAHLLAFTNGNIFTQEGMKNLYRPRVDSLPQPPDNEPWTAPPPASEVGRQVQSAPPDVEAEFLASLRSGKIGSPSEPTRVRQGEMQMERGRSISTSPSVGVPGLNLAREINEIVKEKLSRSPLAQTTRIEIASNLDGSLRILVNNQSYSAPDDIPDEAARTLIKNSIKEWERR